MPTPHGTRGGMAFSAEELRVLRRALAEVLHPSRGGLAPALVPRPAEYVQDYLRLAKAVDEAAAEGGRLRTFALAELRRYREALPGAAAGYLERLTTALAGGYVPGADDLAALRRLRAQSCAAPEHLRRTALLHHCETLAENDVRLRLEAHMPAPRRLLTLPALADEPAPAPSPEPADKAWRAGPAARAARRPGHARAPGARPPHPHPRGDLAAQPPPPQARPGPQRLTVALRSPRPTAVRSSPLPPAPPVAVRRRGRLTCVRAAASARSGR
ncbi:hypothetical protein VSR01_22785 [Actinacidiphila sp. DG2A-62]|uniref:hypothetical protein n=1 Tax=Actinacidiphila sp. DG2A-62 TaxID=3108821 RepID=UPI002DB88FB1|nr:hypothetical protein [Actinacidiphila sp. DG2A-62]MEC3996188.1 hypothetical protein [Actinacidiphila sp. DG2A-62]